MQRRALSHEERQLVLYEWNSRTADYPLDRCLHHLVEAQAALRPDAPAVRCGADALTYGQLNRRANQLARLLESHSGVRPKSLVALCVQRSLDMVVAILGILKAGAAYLPIAAAYPRERVAFMLKDSGAALLLTQRPLRDGLPGFSGETLCLEDIAAQLDPHDAANPEVAVAATDLAYVIYTSGSTGAPKAVLLEHRGTYNTVAAHIAQCGVRPDDRLLQFAAFGFDGAILETLMALGAGAELVLVPQDQLLVGAPLARLLVDGEITMATLQPSVMATLPDWPLPKLRTLISAAEACTGALVARFAQQREFFNAYGPTEASVAVTLGRCSIADGDGEIPSIGRPLPSTRVYILDPDQQPVAIGETGELYLGGVAVARGYLNRPELTAQRFLPDPYSPHPGARMYRSGDLGRFRPDGRIEFLGRVDHQIKLRGFRIELGEVEAALLRHPGIKHCVVLAREDEPGDRRLVAYLVPHPHTAFSIGLLRDFLRATLPEFMIPSAFVALPELPLTAHGKVDRAALPRPGRARPAVASPYAGPRTETERTLVSVFAAVLQLDEVGVRDDFFELGGHSLHAAQAAAVLSSRLGVELPLRTLFAHRTVEALAAYLDGLSPSEPARARIPRRSREQPLPLSPSQQQVWLTSQLDLACPLYNEPYALTIRGPLAEDRLAAALTALIARHEILRTSFDVEDGVPVQRVHAAAPLTLHHKDLRDLAPPDREPEVRRLHDGQARAPFELRMPPLLRALLVRVADDEHRLLLTLHHAIFDGVSFSRVLMPELLRGCRAATEQAALPQPALQYADYAAWAREHAAPERLGPQLAYWRHQLAELPVLQLPTDYPRPAVGSFAGARHPVALGPELSEGLAALAQREGATLYMALLTAFAALLHRYTGQEDVAIAGVTSTQARPELDGLIGPFVNTVVLRADLSREPSFLELLGRVRETVLAALEHRDLPFAALVEALRPERRVGQHPLFQVMFLLDPPGPELPAGWSVSRFEAHNGTAMCDLSLQLDLRPPAPGQAAGLFGFLEYSTQLFAPSTIARWAGHLEVLLRSILAAPTAPISTLALLPERELTQLTAWSGGQVEFPVSACLHELFAAQAERTPDAVAVCCDELQLSYKELNRRANRLARRLQALGVGPDVRVGLCVERTPELVVGILGILMAGGAYVPLDPVYPRDRLSFLLTDTAAPVLVTHSAVRRSLPPAWPGAVIVLDELAAERSAAAADDVPVRSDVTPDHLAYVIYTSGSTGKPKGVPVSHRNVARLFLATDGYFGFSGRDVFCLFHSFAFDFSVWELWGALLYGGRLVLVPYWVSRSPEAFYRLLRSESVTVLNQTPSAFYQLMQAEPLVAATGETLSALRLVIFGGEALDPRALLPWFGRYGEARPQLVNMYGITETTVHVTYQPVGRADCDRPGSHIGVPLPDLRVRVLDRHLQRTPIGIPGELLVGGAGVARGYLNRPELTAARFIADPYGEPGERLYRSGDWVRYREAGTLEYLGRIDQQIKIRGFRIELGEIEDALGEHPEVQTAVAALREDTPGDKRLLAYIVAKSGETTPALAARVRSFVEQKLPSHMVPAAIVPLAALPLTQNGKVDRRALPAPDRARPRLGAEYVAPRTFVEEELGTIFSEVLGVEQVGVHDNFFELGGHSLLVIRVIFRVRETFHIELPMRAVFEAPTIAGLAHHLETLQPGRRGLEVPPITPTRREGRLPLSFGQQRLWFLGQLHPDTPSYNEPVTIRFHSAVNAAALERALDEILRRHEAFRTTFQAIDGDPFQVIHPHAPLQLPIVDLRSLPPEVRETEYLSLCTSEAHRPFSLVEGPLVRFLLLLTGDDDARLFMTFHHVIADGLSIYSVFSVELARLYQAFCAGEPSPLPELSIQYADFAVWQRQWLRSDVVKRQLAYWRKQLGPQLPQLQLPVDHPAPPQPAFRGARELLALPLELTQKLRRLGHHEGATLFITLLAALKALFLRYIEQQDVVVGIVTAGRQRPELAPLLGFFPNTLVLRTQMAGDPSFRGLLQRVREVTLSAFDNQDVPFEQVVEALNPERRPGEMPLFRAGFILDPLTPDLGNKWTMTSTEVEIIAAKFDLCLELVEVPQGVVGRISYRTELFEPGTIQRMARHYLTLLESAVQEPDRPLSRLELLSLSERAQLQRWSAPRATPFPAGCAHELFAAQVDRTPDAPALRYQDEVLSYRALDEQANRVAHALRARGVGPDTIVALCCERSMHLVVGLLGILKAGGAFLALDPAYPRERLAFMLSDAAVELMLTEQALAPQLPAPRREILLLDEEAPAWQRDCPRTRPASPTIARDLAYVIYTSGSTGRPKGVLIEHRSLCNSILAHINELGIDSRDRILQFASPSFDVAVCEIMMALASGATLLLAPREVLLPGPELVAFLAAEAVTLLAITPSALTVLPAKTPLPDLRTLIVGGEPLPMELVERWTAGSSSRRIYNAYGPTEATICASLAQCFTDDGPPPIGRPLANTRIHVLDVHLQPVPVGITGEIFIGGVGLARGYLGRPELTAEKFIRCPFASDPALAGDDRLYRTGDLGRFRPDGQLEFVGRRDTQVKIRGFRIELGEIEAVLSQLSGVREAAVIARTDRTERLLIAYIVAEDPAPSLTTLRQELAEILPQHMIPMAIVPLNELPRTPNGKTDRQALAQAVLRISPPPEVAYKPPENDLEQTLATIWQEVLHVDRVGRNDNFFDLGGHSLRMAQVQARLREVLKREVPLLTLFQYPTIQSLAAFLQGDEETDTLSSSQERGRRRKEAAAQQRRRMTERKKRDE